MGDLDRFGATNPLGLGLGRPWTPDQLHQGSKVEWRTEMIVVGGRVTTDADRRQALVQIGQTVAGASRAEPGCISYRMYEDTEIENEFVFVEEWENSEVLQQHFATSHVEEFMRAIPPTITAPPDVKFHTIASSMDLADVSAR